MKSVAATTSTKRNWRKGSKRVPPPPPKQPPPPVVVRDSQQKLVKSKVIYSNGPKLPPVKKILASWCGLPAYESTVQCVFRTDAITDYSEAIIMAINQETGRVPKSGSVNVGLVKLYLYAAVYSHLQRIGSITTSTNKWAKYGKYRIPTSFAIALQQMGTWKNVDTGGVYTPYYTNLTEAVFDALSFSEGSGVTPIQSGTNNAFGGEPYFDNVGNTVGVADLTDTLCDLISTTLASCMECVQIQYVADFASDCSGLIGVLSIYSFNSLRPVSNVAPYLTLSTSSVSVGPYITNSAVYYTVGNASHSEFSIFVAHHVKMCLRLKYEYKLTIGAGFAKFGVNPNNVAIKHCVLANSVLFGLVCDWLVNNSLWALNSQTDCTNIVNWLNWIYAYLLSKTDFPGRMFAAADTSPFYTTPENFNVGVPYLFGNMGLQTTRVGDVVIQPMWVRWTGARANYGMPGNFISSTAYTPAFDTYADSTTYNATTPVGLTMGGMTQPSDGRLYNACYLRCREEVQRVINTPLVNQTVEFPINKPFCPCAMTYSAGENIYGNTSIILPSTGLMVCPRSIGAAECKNQMAVALDVSPFICDYYRTMSDVGQNRYRPAVEAARVGNNVTQLIATNSGAPWKSALKMYNGNLNAGLEMEKGRITGPELLKAANEYLQQGGPVGPLPSDTFWNTIASTDHNLEELVSKVASGIRYVAPAVKTAMLAYNLIKVHYPIF